MGLDEFGRIIHDGIRRKYLQGLMGDFDNYLAGGEKKRTPEELEYLDRLEEFSRWINGGPQRPIEDRDEQLDEGLDNTRDMNDPSFFKKIETILFGPRQAIAYC